MSHAKVSQSRPTTMQGDRPLGLGRSSLDRSSSSSRSYKSGLSNSRYVWAKRTPASEQQNLQLFSNEFTTRVNSASPLNPTILGDFSSGSPQIWGVRGAKTAIGEHLPCSRAQRSQLETLKVKLAIHLTTRAWHGLGRSESDLNPERMSDREGASKLRNLAQFRSRQRSSHQPSHDLRKTLTEYFQRQESTLDFWAQVRAKLLTISAEDPTLGWQDHEQSDYVVTVIDLWEPSVEP